MDFFIPFLLTLISTIVLAIILAATATYSYKTRQSLKAVIHKLATPERSCVTYSSTERTATNTGTEQDTHHYAEPTDGVATPIGGVGGNPVQPPDGLMSSVGQSSEDGFVKPTIRSGKVTTRMNDGNEDRYVHVLGLTETDSFAACSNPPNKDDCPYAQPETTKASREQPRIDEDGFEKPVDSEHTLLSHKGGQQSTNDASAQPMSTFSFSEGDCHPYAAPKIYIDDAEKLSASIDMNGYEKPGDC